MENKVDIKKINDKLNDETLDCNQVADIKKGPDEAKEEIKREAKKAGATIYFADESGIRSDYHTGHTWAPKGETPVITATGSGYSVNMISAVSAQGQLRFMLTQRTVTAVIFREFLKRLMIGTNKPVFVVVDSHPTHKQN